MSEKIKYGAKMQAIVDYLERKRNELYDKADASMDPVTIRACRNDIDDITHLIDYECDDIQMALNDYWGSEP